MRRVLVHALVGALIVGAVPLVLSEPRAAYAAATTTVGFYSMDEPLGSTTLVDSSGNGRHGTIGTEVVPGARFDGSTAHQFPTVPTAVPPPHPERLDHIPDSTAMDPGTSDYAVTVRYRTTRPFGNIIQKGQNATTGGYWKFEAPQGVVTCLFKGSQRQQRAVNSGVALNDGAWHTVRCERTATALRMTVDGVQSGVLNGSTGNISNDREITISGKGVCDQVTVTCDYFIGDIDYVRIEKASGGSANVAPTAAFVPTCANLTCAFSADPSTDPDGAIQTYAWDFGDGTADGWSTNSHTYAAAGTYTVTLTVTDDRGAVDTTTQELTVGPGPETISYVGEASTSANALTHSAVVPAEVAEGDGLLLFFTQNTQASTGEPTGVTGWRPLDTISGGYAKTRVWRKVAGPGDAGDTVSIALSQQSKANLIVVAYRGTSWVDPVATYRKVADTASTTSHMTPFVDVGEAQSWVVSYWMHGDSTTSVLTPPAGVVTRATGTQSGGGRVTTLLADAGSSVPAAAYGGLVATGADATTTSTAWTLVLAPGSGPVPNEAPQAAVSTACTLSDCAFDGTGSSDGDGLVDAYDWDFGDGTTGSGAIAAHSYSEPGTYPVTLTVTDDDGDTAVATASVTIPHVPPEDVIDFVGQATSATNSATTSFSAVVPATVQPGDGLLLFYAGANTTSVGTPSGVTGWQQLGTATTDGSLTRVWRKVAGSNDAGTTVTVPTGASVKASVTVAAYRGTSATDPIAAFAGIPLTAISSLRTTPAAPVDGEQSWAVSYWTHKDGITTSLTPPPGVTTRAAGTQSSGDRVTTLVADSNGLVPTGSYGGLTATATATSTTASAWTIVLAPLEGPAPNVPPQADFTASCVELDCNFDASSSADSDGTIASFDWDFGDGATGTGVSPAHSYGEGGTYTVSLTVTDDDLESTTVSDTVTVPVTTPADVITFVGQASSNANAVNHTVTIPASVQAGDGLLLFFAENTTATISSPPGWTVLDTVVAGTSTTRVWRKVATSADTAATVTISLSAISKAGLTVAAYRGTSTVDPVAAFAGQASPGTSATRTTPVVAVGGAQSWAVSYWTHKDSSTDAMVPPPGVTVRASGTQTSGGRVTTLVADSDGLVPVGTYGGLSATAAATSSSGTGWTIILAPQG